MESPNRHRATDEDLKKYFPDLPSGRLDEYRKKATFDWRRLKLVYDNLNTIAIKVSFIKLLFWFLLRLRLRIVFFLHMCYFFI